LRAASEALGLLIRLLDREADAALLTGLRAIQAPDLFAALLPEAEGQAGAEALRLALADLPEPPSDADLDALAADYADIFLTHGYRLAPNASVWLTEEKLERQGPMFEVRDWYAHYGITVPDWRKRADDHIVHELQFLGLLLDLGTDTGLQDAAHFLDAQLLPWVPEFGRRMAARAREPLYGAAGLICAAFLEALRDRIEALSGLPRRPRPPLRSALAIPDPEPAPFVPGAAESW
jgi:TorA maturation chaperone TorD